MLSHWEDWLRGSKGLALLEQPHRSTQPVSELSVYVAVPLSKVSDEEKEARDLVVDAIKKGCERLVNVSIKVVMPDFQQAGRQDSGAEIYLKTLSRLHNCDFAIALLTPPATGVGIMARLFADTTMPCASIAQNGTRVSRMFLGMYIRRIGDVIEYASADEVSSHVEQLLKEHLPSLCESAGRRRVIRRRIGEASEKIALNRFITQRYQDFGEAVGHFPQVRFVRPEWLDGFASDPGVLATVTLLQFVHIANKLNWHIGVTPSGVPCFVQTSCVRDQPVESPLSPGREEAAKTSSDVPRSTLPAEQRLLPGMDNSEAPSAPREREPGSRISEAVLFLLEIAQHGLPPCVIARAVGERLEDVNVARLQRSSRGRSFSRTESGVRSTSAMPNRPRTRRTYFTGHSMVCSRSWSVKRTLDLLVDCDRAKSRLPKPAEPIPADLQARLNVLSRRHIEVQSHVRQHIRTITDNNSKEHVQSLILLGCSTAMPEEASRYLDQAIEICGNAARGGAADGSGWRELLARACLARAMVSTRGQDGDVIHDFSRAVGLLRATGNHLAASAAECRLLQFRRHVPEPHFGRTDAESPLVRVEAVRLYRATQTKEGSVVAQRNEVTDAEWDRYVAEAKAKEPWR